MILLDDVELYGGEFQFIIHNLSDIVNSLVEAERMKDYFEEHGTYEEL